MINIPREAVVDPDAESLFVINTSDDEIDAMHLYTPVCFPNVLAITVLKKGLSVITCDIPLAVLPSGPIHSISTLTGTSTSGLNSTAQVKVASSSMGSQYTTTDGAGTVN